MHPYQLEVIDLYKHYLVPRGIVGYFRKEKPQYVHAVDGVNFRIKKGEVMALVGESGSGKTTTALCSAGLLAPTKGTVILDGEDIHIANFDKKKWKQIRRKAQFIFQDPYESLNPRQSVFETVAEPLEVHRLISTQEEKLKKVNQALNDVGLRPPNEFFSRLPQDLSGGQRQRVSIASTLVLNPSLLIADEPVSMLDVSIRAEILNLLKKLRDDYGITILYITHDLATAAYIADRLAVMYLGVIFEIGPAMDVLRNPYHPYTKALLSVIPAQNTRHRLERVILKGEIPNPINIPGGCRFHLRCPEVMQDCSLINPESIEVSREHYVACRLPRIVNNYKSINT